MILKSNNELGFSLVELAVAAVVATALSVVTVTLLSGNASSMSSKSVVAKDASDCYNNGVISSDGEAANCNGGGTGGGNGGAPQSTGVTALWDGAILSVQVDSRLCLNSTGEFAYYYTGSQGGSGLMGTNTTGTFDPTAYGRPLNGDLGYGNLVNAFYVSTVCNGTWVDSDNMVP